MFAIFKKEIQNFFASPIGYLIVGIFLLLNGLFLWVFKGGPNIFDHGFADLGNFFLLIPWIFIFLIPAITMKSFAEERKLGTLELLLIKPISIWQLVFGKFWGTSVVCIMAIVPTFIYIFALSDLGVTRGNYDSGIIMGSYFGTFFLLSAYSAIGLFASTLTDNQIVSLIVGIVLCFTFFHGFEAISTLFRNGEVRLQVKAIGAKAHFESIARGIVDTKDLVYFASVAFFFLYLTFVRLKQSPR